MAEANTTMGDLFGESSGEEEEVAPAAPVPEPAPEAPKQRRRIIDDDDDDEDDFAAPPPAPPAKPDASMSDLFGADSDDEKPAEKDETHKMEDLFGADSDEDKPAEKAHRMEDLFGDDDEDEAPAPVAEAPLQRKLHPKKRVLVKGDKVEKLILPETPAPSATAKAAVLRVPKFVAFEQSPWDPDKPQKEYDEGQAVLRWRLEKDILTGESMLDENNKPRWTSNGRLVKWSDGSMQLIVGSERYDIVERPMKSERLCLQAKPKSGAMCLVSQKALETEMRLRPPSLSSEAHKAFSLRTKKAVVKAKGVKEFFATSDPEMDKRAREKQKDEEIRREARRKAREARGNYSGGGYGGRAAAGMNRAFLEDDEPGLYDDVGDVGALKRSTKAATNEAIFGESDDEEDDGGDFDSRMKRAGRGDDDEEEDEDEAPKSATNADIFGESDDDEDMAEAPPPSEPAVQRKRRVIADEDEDEDM